MSSASELSGMRPTWVDIDTAAFERNVVAVTRRLPAGAKLVAVLKANAYGHGAVELARHCRQEHVAMIATVMAEEAIELRRAAIDLPLLVLGPLTREQIAEIAAHDVVLGVNGPEELALACEVARDREVRIHLELDSGMGRMGITDADIAPAAEMIRTTPGLRLEAFYTHFANADVVSDPFTDEQTAKFDRMIAELRRSGVETALHHRTNSAATLRGLTRPGEFVRIGLALYGGEPIAGERLEPVMRWRTEVVRLKGVAVGGAVGYGMTFRAKRPSRIATLPVGYADGYNRLLGNRAHVLLRGQRVPVVGRVSMDLITIDVTDVPGAAVGDEVVLLGAQGSERITAEELAGHIGTISYEVFCSVSARVPRVYREQGRVTVRSRFTE